MVHNVVDVEFAGFGEALVHHLDQATCCLVPPSDVAMLPRALGYRGPEGSAIALDDAPHLLRPEDQIRVSEKDAEKPPCGLNHRANIAFCTPPASWQPRAQQPCVAASTITPVDAQVLRRTDVRLDGRVEKVHILDLIEAPGLRR